MTKDIAPNTGKADMEALADKLWQNPRLVEVVSQAQNEHLFDIMTSPDGCLSPEMAATIDARVNELAASLPEADQAELRTARIAAKAAREVMGIGSSDAPPGVATTCGPSKGGWSR